MPARPIVRSTDHIASMPTVRNGAFRCSIPHQISQRQHKRQYLNEQVFVSDHSRHLRLIPERSVDTQERTSPYS